MDTGKQVSREVAICADILDISCSADRSFPFLYVAHRDGGGIASSPLAAWRNPRGGRERASLSRIFHMAEL